MIIICKENKLPITKQQFVDGIIPFIKTYKRLPYMSEDDILVPIEGENGSIISSPYRAKRYIESYFDGQDNLTDYLFKKEIITYDLIANIIGSTRTIVENTITTNTKNPDVRVRRGVHIFFNKDFYEDKLDKYNSKCMDCKRKCRQGYWVRLSCSKYKAK